MNSAVFCAHGKRRIMWAESAYHRFPIRRRRNMAEKKENPRIIIDTQVLLELTGWTIDELMQILQVPPQHRQRIIDAITITE